MFPFQAARPTPSRFAVLCLALGLAVVPGCKKKGKDSKSPDGASKADIERAVESAKKEAKSATLIDIANEDLRKGRYVSASKRAEEALADDPQNADAHAILGAARWRAGDYTGSTKAYEEAVQADASNFGANIGLARNLQAAGQHERVIELMDALLAKDKEQVDPYLTKLWSYYATCNAKKAVEMVDVIFQKLPAEDPQLQLVQAYAAFMRPLADQKGELCTVAGQKGSSSAGIDHQLGAKTTAAVVAGEFAPILMLENTEEAVIDADFAKTLKLKPVGKFKPLGQDKEQDLVVIPEIKFGEISLKNVPAIVRSLADYDQITDERPGVILGRQALQAFGSMTFDFPNNKLTLTKDAPGSAPADSAELPLLLVSMYVLHAPAVPLKIGESEHEFWAYFGGVYKAGVAVTKKHYFKSGHLPREVDPPDDPAAGLKMVYVDDVKLGETNVGGTGGLVLVNTPADPTLGTLLDNTAFELGGYVNLALMETWAVTYALPQGKVYIKPMVTG